MFRLFYFTFCSLMFLPFIQAQEDCPKAWMHYERRVQLSKITKEKFGLDVPIDKIQIDFLGAPLGIPYRYADYSSYVKAKDTVHFDKEHILHREAYSALEEMRKAARKDSLYLKVLSAHRDAHTQAYFYKRFGAEIAEKPGFSEHQLHTAIDIDQVKKDSRKFLWLLEHAFQFGWVPSYYFRIGDKKPEAWHWRYVGHLAADKFRCAWKKEITAEILRIQKIHKKKK